MLAKLSVIGLYNYDNSLFDGLVIPAAMDKQAMIDLILTECSEFATRYPKPDFFKDRLTAWCTRKLPIWERLYRTTTLEYEPLQNYDRTETHTENITHRGTDSTSATSETTQNSSAQSTGSQQHTGTVQSVQSDTDTKAQTAFDSATFTDSEKITTSHTGTDTNNLTDTTTGSETRNTTDLTATDGTRTVETADVVTRQTRAYGNIGVTTSQQMLESERDVSRFDIYEVILNDFIDTFCVAVY